MEVDLGPSRHDSDGDGGAKRRRVTLACEQCRRRKIKCDATKPACGNCLKTEFACVYVPTKRTQTRIPDLNGAADAAKAVLTSKRSHAQRLDRIEELLARLVDKKRRRRPHSERASTVSSDEDSSESSESEVDSDAEEAKTDTPPVEDSPVVDCISSFPFGTKEESSVCYSSIHSVRGVKNLREAADEDVVMYNHGPFGTLTAPKNVRLWAELSGDKLIGEKLCRAIRNTWKQQLLYIQHLSALNSDALVLDAPLVEFCFERFVSMKAPYFHSILSPDEFRELQRRSNWITAVRSGSPHALIYTSIVICICAFMLMTGEHHHFSKELLERQIEVACLVGLRSINLTPMVPPTFSLFRALVLFALVTSMISTFAQVEHVISVAYRVAVVIGLNREEFYANLTPDEAAKRRCVWWVCFFCDLTLSTYLAHAPVFDVDDISTALPQSKLCLDNESVSYLPLGVKLQRIYGRLYSGVFSVKGFRRSPDAILRTVIELDTELTDWYAEFKDTMSQLPDLSMNEGFDQQGTVDWMTVHVNNILDIEYHMITLQLYSLLLFSPLRQRLHMKPRKLSSRLRHPLDTYTEAAEKCIEFSSRHNRQLNGFATCVSITTGMVSLFIKHLVFPDHDRNAHDRKLIRDAATSFHWGVYMPLAIVPPLRESWMILVNALDLSVHRKEVIAIHQARKEHQQQQQKQQHQHQLQHQLQHQHQQLQPQPQQQSQHSPLQSQSQQHTPLTHGPSPGQMNVLNQRPSSTPPGHTPETPPDHQHRPLPSHLSKSDSTSNLQKRAMAFPQRSVLPQQNQYAPESQFPNGIHRHQHNVSLAPFQDQLLNQSLQTPSADQPYGQAPPPYTGAGTPPVRESTPGQWQLPSLGSPSVWNEPGNGQPSLILNAEELLGSDLYPDLAGQENVGLDRCTIC